MKKILSLLMAAAAAVNLGSCADNNTLVKDEVPGGDGHDLGKGTNEVDNETVCDEVTLDGRIAFADEDGVYFTYSDSVGNGGFRRLDTAAAKILKADGTQGDEALLVSGLPVSVEFDGNVFETYPERIAPTKIVLGDESEADNLLEMFLTAFDYLFESDEGLNDNLKYLAFDLSDLDRFNEGEKEAFIWKASEKCGLEPLTGNHDSLLEDGYIVSDEGFMSFPEGLLVSFSTTEAGGDNANVFEFEMSKWRSSLGAIFLGCKAEKNDSVWSYTNESFAIS